MKPTRRSEPVTVEFTAEHTTTEKAYLLEIGGEKVWIPKSQVVRIDWDNGELVIPRWLAEEKGLISEPADIPARIH